MGALQVEVDRLVAGLQDVRLAPVTALGHVVRNVRDDHRRQPDYEEGPEGCRPAEHGRVEITMQFAVCR
jgi:hypothetical protein